MARRAGTTSCILRSSASYRPCGRWLKRKGVAQVQLASSQVALAEIHWYECAGIGKREFKINRFL